MKRTPSFSFISRRAPDQTFSHDKFIATLFPLFSISYALDETDFARLRSKMRSQNRHGAGEQRKEENDMGSDPLGTVGSFILFLLGW